MVNFIVGGNKSGKSDFAYELFLKSASPHKFVATGKAEDLEFREQILAHKRKRAGEIPVFEINTNLAKMIEPWQQQGGSILIDSIDFWLFSVLNSNQITALDDFIKLLKSWRGANLFCVSTEIGLGPLPMNAVARKFARELGRLNQLISSCSQCAYFVIFGNVLKVK